MHVWGTVAGPGPGESGRAVERAGRTPPRFSSPAVRGGRSGRAADTEWNDRAISKDHGVEPCQGRHA